jgi:DNA-binding MarR family transcriptional regulator
MIEHEVVAREIVEIIPLLMRNVAVDLRCAGIGMAPAHFRLLGMLAHHPYNLSELAEQQEVTMATMSNSVNTLVERGWVQRIPVLHDRRMIKVELTPAGKQMLVTSYHHLVQRVDQLISQLTDDELDQIQNGMVILQRVFDNSPEKASLSFDRSCE